MVHDHEPAVSAQVPGEEHPPGADRPSPGAEVTDPTPSADRAPADSVNIETLLRRAPLLAGLDRAAQDSLLWRFRALPFDAGDAIITAGGSGSDLVLLLEGFAEVYAPSGDSRYLVAILEPGSIIGEIAFFDPQQERTADVIGATRGMAAVLPRSVYDELLEEESPAAESLERAVLQAVSLRMQYTNETLAELLDTHRSGSLLSHLARLFAGKE
ncbi:MAG: cyclic nucleotide-binding domain-containing protein [Deltaproteobacteria bacterium]|nr:MAG: cyclic nucleotide-binding domain-containing protein [Deltaproteobacteria bacterium]